MKEEPDGFAAAIHGNRHGLVLVEGRALVHLVPGGIVHAVEVADDVAGFKTGLGSR